MTTTAQMAAGALAVDDLRAAVARATTPDAGLESVEVRETHISRVFLAGDRAFKLKKALKLPFVDYSTPQLRREMCRQEVCLNRRLAPDVYLGVVGLAPSDDGFDLVAEEDPAAVDFLVEMRRFDEASTMASRLRAGTLTEQQVGAVGRVLARFHAGAPVRATESPPAIAVERRWSANFHELLLLVDQRAEVGRVLALERFAHAFVVAHDGLLRARAFEGWVRDGHGDLRADHVLIEDEVRIVDCVEFDPALRRLDVADDLAFLVMDLVARGHDSLARTLVWAYRDAGGDPGPPALVSFYAAHRALVRAKVALWRAAQLDPAGPAHGRASMEARDLLAVAERFAWRARLPLAVVVCGVPASGKSHLAQRLAEASGLSHLGSDATRKRLAGVAPYQRAPDRVYRDDFNRRTYAELGHRAAQIVASDGGAIVDATFRHREDREAFTAGFGRAAPVVFIECVAPARVLAARAAERDRGPRQASDADAEVVERERTSWEPLDEVQAARHLVIRSDRPVEALVEDLVGFLDQRPR